MKIAVCVSHVPDTAAKIKISSDGKNIENAGVSFVINPYDEFAVEEALKQKEKFGGEVVVFSLGGEECKETIRKALAMGADSGVLLKSSVKPDSFGVARALAADPFIKECTLIFFGKQSVDYDNGIVGQLTAELLGYGCVSVCVALDINGDSVTAEREIEGGREVIAAQLPLVITAQKGLNEPRYASMKGIMAAKKKTIEEREAQIGGISTEVVSLELPAAKGSGKILTNGAADVPELVRLLHEDAKVI